MAKARYIMVGGFLGAGKTTALLRLAERLRGEGRTVGLITNDQSVNLVDTAMLAEAGTTSARGRGAAVTAGSSSAESAAELISATR